MRGKDEAPAPRGQAPPPLLGWADAVLGTEKVVWMRESNLSNCLYSEQENSFKVHPGAGAQLNPEDCTGWEARQGGLGLGLPTPPLPLSGTSGESCHLVSSVRHETQGHGSEGRAAGGATSKGAESSLHRMGRGG